MEINKEKIILFLPLIFTIGLLLGAYCSHILNEREKNHQANIPVSDGDNKYIHYTIYDDHTILGINKICLEIASAHNDTRYFVCTNNSKLKNEIILHS